MKTDIKDDTSKESESILSSLNFFKKDKQNTPSESLKEAVDAYIEETSTTDETGEDAGVLLSNVLELKEQDVTDIMIPRADIIAVEVESSVEDLLELLTEQQFSRIPVYKETLDNILGTIHIKDILAKMAKGEAFDIKSLIRQAPIVSPAMPILDLVHLMRQQRRHMVLVVDEYGGIDGLVTIGDIVEEVLGEIDDEYNNSCDKQELLKLKDNVYRADARLYIDNLEQTLGIEIDIEEEDEVDTIGGLISAIAGRLPARGEIIDAPEIGLSFKIIDADPRRIKHVELSYTSPAHSSLEGEVS